MVQHGVLGRGCSACCCGGIVVVVVAGVLVVAVAVAVFLSGGLQSPDLGHGHLGSGAPN